MNSDTELVSAATDAVCGAATLDDALAAVVAVLRPRFDLWHASFCSHPTGDPHVTILASWSLAESILDAGAAIAADISQIIVGVLAELHAGNPARFVVGGDPDSLVEHLLAANGVSSMVTVPIHCDDEGLLLLALGTGSSDAFLDVGRSFFIELGHGLSKTVLPLVAIKDDPSGSG